MISVIHPCTHGLSIHISPPGQEKNIVQLCCKQRDFVTNKALIFHCFFLSVSFTEGWCKFLLPGPVGCLCDTESLLWFCDASDNVFVAEVDQLPHQLKWQKTGNFV